MKRKYERRRLPQVWQLREELEREHYKKRYKSALRSTFYILVVTAAAVVLVTFLLCPVFRIYGSSMSPTVNEGEIVVASKFFSFDRGDVVVLNFNNKLLVKRVIACAGQWVNIDASGNVFVDGVQLEEPYLKQKAYGDCNITLPYQVPEGRYFVMGDNRATSQDSRNNIIGCIPKEQIVGRVLLRVWPMDMFGTIQYRDIERTGAK